MRRSVCCLLILSACGGPADIGGACDPADAESCLVDLVCAPDAAGENTCQVPLGALCELGRDPTSCVAPSACVEVTETVDGEDQIVGRCYLPEGATCDPTDAFCSPGLRCAELSDGTHQCHLPLLFRGRVLDSTDESGIADALVIGLDDRPVAVTDVATSGPDGSYELDVPVVRDADGAPIDTNFTLRGSADGYQTFPGGIRTAIPINSTQATRTDTGWVVEGTNTDVVLIPLEDLAAPRVSISGHVVAAGDVGGVLVVAEPGGHSALSDVNGAYTIFNVTPGDYEVRGYAADLQLMPASASASVDLEGVDLVEGGGPLSTLSGSINIVNAFGGAVTSVVLVVQSTFSDTFGRGEVPPGLRAPRTGPVSVSGGWTISGVPDGSYVVLAAFENDRLVRDPDQLIAGTSVVTVDLPQATPDVTLSDAFKVTEALAVVSPGAERPDMVSSAPTLEWADDSSEDHYEVVVYDAFGNLAWEDPMVPGVSGAASVSVMYGGPLEPGMFYQFRATSIRTTGGGRTRTPISATEDLLGVFFVAP